MAITKRGFSTSLLAGALPLLYIVSIFVPDNVPWTDFEAVRKHSPFSNRPVAIPILPVPIIAAAKIAIPFGSNSTLRIGNLSDPFHGQHPKVKRFTW